MPYDPNDEDTKAAVAEEVRKATEKLEAKVQQLIGEKRRQGEGKVDAAELERVEAELSKAQADLAASQRELTKTAKQLETATKTLESEQANTHNLLIENGLTAALAEAGVKDPNFLKAAKATILLEHKPGVVVDGDKRVAKVGDKALGDFVKEWAQGAEGKTFVAAPGNGGGGAPGGQGGGGAANPFAKESFNLTEQSRLYKENPTQAKAFAAQAGVTLE